MVQKLKYNNTKIAFFAPNLEGGGAERVISILSELFFNKGYKVELLLNEAKGPYLSKLPSEIKVIQFNAKKVILALPQLISYLNENRPHILFTSHLHCSSTAIWATKLANTNTKVIVRQPTMLRSSEEKQSLKKKLNIKVFLATVKFADHIIVTSKAMAEEFLHLSRIPSKNVTTIYNPLPIDKIMQLANEPLSENEYSLNRAPTIIAVGRLEPVKDFSTLIKAFSILYKQLPIQLLILGEGPQRNELEALIRKLNLEDAVKMPGFVSNPYKYIKNSNTFVLSSLREGFPNSMVEAMACNIHIVATDCNGGTAEILEYGKWGELTPVRDPYSMAQSILDTFDSNYNIDTYKRAQNFSLDKIFYQYCQVFDICLENSH